MLNKAQVIGNLGSDPKVTNISNGQTKVASFSVATTDPAYTSKSGVQVAEKTEWHNVVCFGKLADVAEKWLRKGSKVFIEGKMRTRTYDDRNGVKRSVMEIVADYMEMVDSRQSNHNNNAGGDSAPAQAAPQSANPEVAASSNDDDLPF